MPPTTFHLFPTIPIELRHLIWTFALPGPRRIAPSTVPSHKLTPWDSRSPTPKHCCPYNPVTLAVNRESREVALRHYQTWFNASSVGYQYIDFSIDAIYFDAAAFVVQSNFPRMALLKLARIDMQRIETLDLVFYGLRSGTGEELKKWIRRCLRVFTGVRELRVLLYAVADWMGHLDVEEEVRKMVDLTRDLGEKGLEEYARNFAEPGKECTPPILTVIRMEV
jgi:hypothetical protein